MDAGHFKSRIFENTLFDEKNVHAQCKGCNMPPNNGRPLEYSQFLDAKYGHGTAVAINGRARRRKLERAELVDIIAKYSDAEGVGEAKPNRTDPLPVPSPPLFPSRSLPKEYHDRIYRKT